MAIRRRSKYSDEQGWSDNFSSLKNSISNQKAQLPSSL